MILITYRNTKLIRANHRAGFKKVFQKLIVYHSSSSLNLNDITNVRNITVCLKGFFNSTICTIQYWNSREVIAFLAFLNCKPESFESRTYSSKHFVAF